MEDRMDMDAMNRVASRLYQVSANHGFHDGEVKGFQTATTERVAIFIANLHGECSELWEAARKDALYETCDKGIDLTNAEEEIADIVIRAMDTAHALGIQIGDAVAKKTAYNKLRPHKHGKKC